MQRLLILSSADGDLVFGMDWLPLIGRRAERSAYRAARQYRATHIVLDGADAAAVGLAAVPPSSVRAGRPLHSAARNLACLFPTGAVAVLLPVEPGAFWVAGVHEGTVVAGTDKLYESPDRAAAGLEDLKRAFPHLRIPGSPGAPELPTLAAIRAAGTQGSALLRARGARRAMPGAAVSLALALALVFAGFWTWRRAAPAATAAAASPRTDPAAAWRRAAAKARKSHVVHGVQGTRAVLDALYALPVRLSGWDLTKADCVARMQTWDCRADYRRVGPDADNDSFLAAAPRRWTVAFPSIDRASPRWSIASGAQNLDGFVSDSSRHNDRYLLSRFQSIAPAFTQLHVGDPVPLPVPPPGGGRQGAARPEGQQRFLTRAIRVRGPLRSFALLLPHTGSIEWKQAGIAHAPVRRAALTSSRLMASFEGVLHEIESSPKSGERPQSATRARPKPASAHGRHG